MDNLSVSTPRELAGHYKATRERLWNQRPVISGPASIKQDPLLHDANMRELAKLRLETKIFRDFLTERGVDVASIINRKNTPSTNYVHRVMLKQIFEAVCERFLVMPTILKADLRARELTTPRHIAFYLSRNLSGKSMPDIGRYFGRDHTTVLHGWRRISDLIRVDSDLAQDVALLHIDLGITGRQ